MGMNDENSQTKNIDRKIKNSNEIFLNQNYIGEGLSVNKQKVGVTFLTVTMSTTSIQDKLLKKLRNPLKVIAARIFSSGQKFST